MDGCLARPAWRFDLEGQYQQPLTVQWAGSLDSLRSALLAEGWSDPVPLSGKNLLLWLDATRSALQLPVLPHAHDGRHEALVLVYPVADQLEQRLLLRLWPADIVLQDPDRPLWIGMVVRQTMRRPLSLFNLPRDDGDFNQPRQAFLESLSAVPVRLGRRDSISRVDAQRVVWDGQTVSAKESATDESDRRGGIRRLDSGAAGVNRGPEQVRGNEVAHFGKGAVEWLGALTGAGSLGQALGSLAGGALFAVLDAGGLWVVAAGLAAGAASIGAPGLRIRPQQNPYGTETNHGHL